MIQCSGEKSWREIIGKLADHCQNFVFAHQKVFFSIDFDVFASVACEKHVVTGFELQCRTTAIVQNAAIANAYDLASGRAILGGVRQKDPAACLFL